MSLLASEWPYGVVSKMTSGIIITAQKIREVSGVPVVPSPVPEAHVREEDGTSRHAIGRDGLTRLSDGTDLFLINNIDAAKLWRCAQQVPELGGFGMYFDAVFNGEKRVLVHYDNRPGRLMWLCPSRDRTTEKREYIYFRDNNPGVYLDILSAELSRL